MWFDFPFRLVGPTDLISTLDLWKVVCLGVTLIPLTIAYGMVGIGSNENGISKL